MFFSKMLIHLLNLLDCHSQWLNWIFAPFVLNMNLVAGKIKVYFLSICKLNLVITYQSTRVTTCTLYIGIAVCSGGSRGVQWGRMTLLLKLAFRCFASVSFHSFNVAVTTKSKRLHSGTIVGWRWSINFLLTCTVPASCYISSGQSQSAIVLNV